MSDGNKVMSYGNGKSKQIFKYFMSTPSPQTYLIYKPFFLRTLKDIGIKGVLSQYINPTMIEHTCCEQFAECCWYKIYLLL